MTREFQWRQTPGPRVPAPAGARSAGPVSNIWRGCVGNLIEWYDWYAYTAFTVYFAAVFFPAGDQTAQLLNTAAVFAVGFLMRPIGGWLLGRYAARHGRRAALTLSISLMVVSSLIVAFTPSYDVIGLAALALLVAAQLCKVCRLAASTPPWPRTSPRWLHPVRRGY